MLLKHLRAGVLVFAALAGTSLAGEMVVESDYKGKQTVVEDEFPYTKGTMELELKAGVFGSLGTKGTPKRPDTGYAIGELRLGFMLTDAQGDGFLRGNLEFLIEAFGGGIFEGPGDVLVGANIFLRYNFVQLNSRVVPYVQIGGGGAYSDAANDDPIQRNIGSDFSFVLEAELGIRYHFTPRCALNTAVEFRHISNASTSDRNQGLNSLGGLIGVSYFF